MSIANNPAIRDRRAIELDEEFNNFMQRVTEVSNLVKDMGSGDKDKAEAAKFLADQYLDGKIILDEDILLKVKQDRTLINEKAFKNLVNKDACGQKYSCPVFTYITMRRLHCLIADLQNKMTRKGEMDKEAWMSEVSKDAEKRYQDRKVRREKADTLKTQAMKAFRRQEYDRALSCYNRAIEQVRDDPMLYCDRALTKIKLRKFDQIAKDCDLALRLNENSFKARLYQAKAYKELEELDKLQESCKELDEMFPQHHDLIKDFLDKKEDYGDEEETE